MRFEITYGPKTLHDFLDINRLLSKRLFDMLRGKHLVSWVSQMGYVNIQEPIEVVAHFSSKGTIKPLVFLWAGRKYQVKQTTYRWRSGRGRATLRFFAVVTATNDAYQLCYRDEDATWRLETLWAP